MVTMKATVTNKQVGADLFVSHATVSRIRSGDRLPSIDLMLQIEKVTRWKLDRQIRARQDGSYAAKFEEVLTQHYAPADEFHPPAAANYGVG